MLDVSSGIEILLEERDKREHFLDTAFNPVLLRDKLGISPDDPHSDYLLSGDVRRQLQSALSRRCNGINFHSHDEDPNSDLYHSFLLGMAPFLREFPTAIDGIKEAQLDNIFKHHSTLSEFVTNECRTPLPEGWVTNIWHDREPTARLVGPADTTRLLLDIDQTLLFPAGGSVQILRPNALEFIREVKKMGVKVGIYTHRSRRGVHDSFNCKLYDDSNLDGVVTWDGNGSKFVLPYTEAIETLHTIASEIDFAVTKCAYTCFSPWRTASIEEAVLRNINSFNRLLPARKGVYYSLGDAKVLPRYGNRTVLLDDAYRPMSRIFSAFDFDASGTLVKSPCIEDIREGLSGRDIYMHEWGIGEFGELVPLLLANNRAVIEEVIERMNTPEEELAQKNVGMP